MYMDYYTILTFVKIILQKSKNTVIALNFTKKVFNSHTHISMLQSHHDLTILQVPH